MPSASHAPVDAVVVGSGPNGLAAAVTLARAGLRVTVLERSGTVGGGASTAELTVPGAWHDVCSAVHPMAIASPFFRAFQLDRRVEMLTPEISYAQPVTASTAAVSYRDLERTAEGLGQDAAAWRQLLGPLVRHEEMLAGIIGDTMIRIPDHPLYLARFGLRVLQQGTPIWNEPFREPLAPALLSGVFAHTIQKMPNIGTSAAGLALATLAHGVGWPIPRGGSQSISQAMVDDLLAHGGSVETGVDVRSLDEVRARAVLLDVTPRALIDLAGDALPAAIRFQLQRFRYGNAAAKADFVLSEPVPWANPELRNAVTVHVGGTRADVARAEEQVARGGHADQPFVLTAQPTVLDPTRAPEGRHILWAYTHVPAGSDIDQTDTIIDRIEHFAPGFRDTILHVHSRTARRLSHENPNDFAGDIAAGAVTTPQLVARPRLTRWPWSTGVPGVYLCSASTAPGPGVHGQVGWHAALLALRREFGIAEPPDLSITSTMES
jgi:phytoene dehydrogenase-like protein